MEDRLRRWIESEQMPADFYELLGLSRLESNQASIETAVHAAYRIIHPYQNHRDSQRAQRARQLQMLLGDVCNTISDPAKWRQYDEHLIEDLCEQYACNNGRDVHAWKRAGLRRWLSAVKNVHPDRVNDLVQDFLATAGGTAEQPKPEAAFIEDDAVSRLKQVFGLSVRPPNPHLSTANIYPNRSRPDSKKKRRPERPDSKTERRPETPTRPSIESPGATTQPHASSFGLGCLAAAVITVLILAVFAAGLGVLAWVVVR